MKPILIGRVQRLCGDWRVKGVDTLVELGAMPDGAISDDSDADAVQRALIDLEVVKKDAILAAGIVRKLAEKPGHDDAILDGMKGDKVGTDTEAGNDSDKESAAGSGN